MRHLWILLAVCNVVASCEYNAGNLCEGETAFKTYDYAGLRVYGALEDGLRCARAKEKPIFLLFSGFACVGDTSYEEELFVEKSSRLIIEQNYVPVILFVDDKTKLKEGNIIISRNGKERIIKTVGDRNALYEMDRFNLNVQPLLVILDHIGNSIIDPIGYESSSALYQEFLQSGIERYQYLFEGKN